LESASDFLNHEYGGVLGASFVIQVQLQAQGVIQLGGCG
jgi:hypothetical protein